jgi:DNA-binding response OmpR family regulator
VVSSPEPPSVTPNLLVVSDNSSVRDELEYGFPDGVMVSFAYDALDAWAWLQDQVPSAVVVDLQTGKAGGYGLARDMAADLRLRDVPVVMLLDREQDRWLAQQVRATVVMTKPISASDVVRRLETILSPIPQA